MVCFYSRETIFLHHTALFETNRLRFADDVHAARGGWQTEERGPGAGRVAAQPWMTRCTRPEGTDNGQRILTLRLCQNVSTFSTATSTPSNTRIPILWSREL